MQRKKPEISVVLPAYNEEANIKEAVEKALEVLKNLCTGYEVVVVDDGSTDRTGEISEELSNLYPGVVIVYHHARNRGYGAALRTGLFNAQGRFVFYTDADNQFDLKELKTFLQLIESYDIVVGYRNKRRDSFLRKFLSKGYNFLIRCLFGLSLRDIDCSFKLFRQDVLRRLKIDSDDFFVDTEMMVRARLSHFKIAQQPVTHLPRKFGVSTVRAIHIPTTFLTVLKMWWKIFISPAAGQRSPVTESKEFPTSWCRKKDERER